MSGQKEILMRVEHVSKDFLQSGGTVSAVSDVSFDVYRGETLALVGESGCGKSTLGRLMLRLIEPTQGSVWYENVELGSLNAKQMRGMRRKMQMIFQDPFASLDPRMTIGEIIEEPLKIHKLMPDKKARRQFVRSLMERTGIRPEYENRYPHQFSGGQRQRIGIARALVLDPELVICDEPVSALDVSIQAQILNLLQDIQQERKLTYLFISHDLSVVRYISHRVLVMFLGQMCEIGEGGQVYEHALHPYTRFLVDSVPQPDPELRKEEREILQGEVPSPLNPPSGCRFHTRCPYAQAICSKEQPQMREYEKGHFCACHFPLIPKE